MHNGRERSTAHIHVCNGIIKNQTPLPCAFQNFHIIKFLDSRTTILMSRTAIMADCVEVTPTSSFSSSSTT